MSVQSILLKDGIILQHDEYDNVNILRDTDLLVAGNKVKQIGKNITGPGDCQVIDYSAEGETLRRHFIGLHTEGYVLVLQCPRGFNVGLTDFDIETKGNMQCFNYTPQDVFWGELGGCLEALDAGTTCLVDHAHMTYSQEHALAGLSGAITSGIRSVFCYSIIPRLKRWDKEVEAEEDPIPDWSVAQLNDLAHRQPFGNGRVTIGLGFDTLDAPQERVVGLYQTARKAGVKTITSHWRKNNIAGSSSSVPETLHKYSLLGPDILLSHATGSSSRDFSLLKSTGACISSTPATESQMAHGEIVCFRPDVNASLGADCHSANSASMLHAMHIGLAVARSHRNNRVLESGKFPREIKPKTLQAFNLATIRGARVLGMQEEVGSLQEGKKADLIIFSTDTPAMACAVSEDPLVAVVRHATTREVETVIADGVVRKLNGKLLDVEVDGEDVGSWDGQDQIAKRLRWSDVSKQLLRSREEIQIRIDECDVEKAKKITMKRWGASSDGGDVFV